jgi:hypothetical protein
MPKQHATVSAPVRWRRPIAPLHVFLRHDAAGSRVSALSVVALPECFRRVRANDLRDAQRQSSRLRTEGGDEGGTVFLDVEVLLDRDARSAMRAAEQLSATPSAAEPTLRYVGTPRGLAGFIDDLLRLGIADGVTLLPARPADGADRIINDVLPMLGLDVTRLSA